MDDKGACVSPYKGMGHTTFYQALQVVILKWS